MKSDIDRWFELAQCPEKFDWQLICFPFAGGYAEYYLPWRKYLTDCALFPVQLPGRSFRWREDFCLNMDDLTNRLSDVIAYRIHAEKPLVFFGHSMGGYIAYMLAKKIRMKHGISPQLLVTSATPAPSFWKNNRKLSNLTEKSFERFFINLGGFHPELLKHPDFMKKQLHILRQDLHLCESCHVLEPAQFDFPILSLTGSQDIYVLPEQIVLWRQETCREFAGITMEGNHFYLNEQAQTIIALIKKSIALKQLDKEATAT